MLDNTNPKYDADFFTFPNGVLGLKVTIPTIGNFVVCTDTHEEYFLSLKGGFAPEGVPINGEIYFPTLRSLDDAIADTMSVRVKWGWK